MLAMSPFCPTLGWDYPLELETNHVFDNFVLDSSFFPDFLPCQLTQDYQDNNQESNHDAKRSESPQGTSSIDHSDHNPILAKKLDHNASERDRRKKINSMYASLRKLLPLIDQRKKLSIPATVTRVLEYIPELQKEVENLNHKKEVMYKKISAQGNPRECMTTKETASYSITINKVDEKEMVIQISALEKISISEVLLLLEKNGHFIFDVSCFLSFGGRTFYNVHLWMDGSHNVNCENLNEVLLSILQKQDQMQIYS
ncbi:unnamed protein product [Amaranthus hypochondriacus]